MPQSQQQPVDPEVILMQVMSAIGQGAGTVRVGQDATALVRSRYLEAIRQYDSARWRQDRAVALEWARVVGRKAASLAAEDASFEITADQLSNALDRAARSSDPDGPCPFTPREFV